MRWPLYESRWPLYDPTRRHLTQDRKRWSIGCLMGHHWGRIEFAADIGPHHVCDTCGCVTR